MLPVYCKHFGLTREPFNVTPDPNFLYLSASHQEALAQLVYGIKARRGFVVLTGEVGTGKTTLIHALLNEINDGHTQSALIFNPTGSPKDFLRCLCEEFAITSPVEKQSEIQDYLTLLNQFLLDCYRKGDNIVLIIDEAQNLAAEVLERVRLLSNFETQQEKLLQILLVGQPELGDRLNQPELRQLKQRVALRNHLNPLNLKECKEYIARRLKVSGGRASLFSATAIETVHIYSGGIPRLVNILCDNGLLSAYARCEECVEAGMIDEIARELEIIVLPQAVPTRQNNVTSKPKEIAFSDPKKKIIGFSNTTARRGAPLKRKLFDPNPLWRGDLAPATTSESTAIDLEWPTKSKNGSSQKGEALSDVVPPGFFRSMICTLTEDLGPMAPLILSDHIAAMGESKEAFPKHRIGQLVDKISLEILNVSMKSHFQHFISKELQTMVGAGGKLS